MTISSLSWRLGLTMAFATTFAGGCVTDAATPDGTPHLGKAEQASRNCPNFDCDPHPIPDPQPTTGYIIPKYEVLSLIYAPPGNLPGNGQSIVTYASESSTGATTSVSRSFKAANSFSAQGSLLGAGFTATAGSSTTGTTTSQLTIKKTATSAIADSGPSHEGIDHNYDFFVLWLNPRADFSILGTNVTYGESVNPNTLAGPNMDIQYVYIAWLKDPASMPAGVAKELSIDRGAGAFTAADYAALLALDPYASNAAMALDANRFRSINVTLPYEPAPVGSPPVTTSYELTNGSLASHSLTVTESYSVGYGSSGGASFGSWLSANVQSTSTFTWENSNSFAWTTDNTQSAKASITGPDHGYTGPTDALVYFDTMHGTFFFAFISPTAALAVHGTVLDANYQPVANQEVVMTVDGVTRRTFTRHDGEYRFFDTPAGHAVIEVKGATEEVTLTGQPIERHFTLR